MLSVPALKPDLDSEPTLNVLEKSKIIGQCLGGKILCNFLKNVRLYPEPEGEPKPKPNVSLGTATATNH